MKVYKFGITQVAVHIKEVLNKEHRKNLSENISNLNGISCVFISDQKPHVMQVCYNPQTIDSQQVLEGVENTGLHVQLQVDYN